MTEIRGRDLGLLAGVLNVKRLACELACGKVTKNPLSEDLLDGVRAIMAEVPSVALGRSVSANKAPDQRVCLDLLAGFMEAMGDPVWFGAGLVQARASH